MSTTGHYHAAYFIKERNSIAKRFDAYIKKHVSLPREIMSLVFPGTFFSDVNYMVFPYFFAKAFKNRSVEFLNMLSISGFLYFKYLICVDSLLDRDVAETHENNVPDSILLSRSHVYHEESIKILSTLFEGKTGFWKTWKTRNQAFYKGVLLDKKYNLEMPFEVYKFLSTAKCSFLKATLDGFYWFTVKQHKGNEYYPLYKAMIKSFDYLAIGTCLLDDFEDFKKDLLHKKNNHAHVLLQQWLSKQGKALDEKDPRTMEKYFYASTVAEQVLQKSKDNLELAITAVQKYENLLPEYTRYLEAFRNKSNLLKVNVEAYRVTALIEKIKVPVLHRFKTVEEAIAKAAVYIDNMQNAEGSWFDISNKQGLSNIWSTAFIAMNLDSENTSFRRAARFLRDNKQNGLWGYNKDWVPDFDSATCSLSVLNKAHYKVDHYMQDWWRGQKQHGGFSTYGSFNRSLVSYLGIDNSCLENDWTREHVCVSALAYYFLSASRAGHRYAKEFSALKKFLLDNKTNDGVWQPYWWTSIIYPTTFIIKGMIKEEKAGDKNIINKAVESLLANQLPGGGFACDILKSESIFYTSLVLDTLCQDPVIFSKNKERIENMKQWILTRQYQDGSFENSNFLVIPNFTSDVQQGYQSLKINKAGGGGSITGEVAGLFSTAVTYRALRSYQSIKKQA